MLKQFPFLVNLYVKMNPLKSLLFTLLIILTNTGLAQSDDSTESISLADKNILVVWGGWDGHQPDVFAKKISEWARSKGANVTVSDSLGVYTNSKLMKKQDLIIQYWTMGTITDEQSKGLIEAIKSGTGLVGCHGGIGDSFRNNTDYQYMVGGQWVTHPGGKIDYTVQISNTGDPVTKGLQDFEIRNTEQYYMHVDPNVRVLATTTFNAEEYSIVKNCSSETLVIPEYVHTLSKDKLSEFTDFVFDVIRPKILIVTTVNKSFNSVYNMHYQ